MVRFIQSSLKCNNNLDSSLEPFGVLVHICLKNLSYTLSHFRHDATTFCNMKPSYFYYIIQNHYQKGLDEKLLNSFLGKVCAE